MNRSFEYLSKQDRESDDRSLYGTATPMGLMISEEARGFANELKGKLSGKISFVSLLHHLESRENFRVRATSKSRNFLAESTAMILIS